MDGDATRILKLSGVPLKGSNVEQFMDQLKEMSEPNSFNPRGVILDNCAIVCFPSDGNRKIHISSMDSHSKGSGSIALKKLCDLADKLGVTLSLLAYGYAQTPTAKLVEWYVRHGFVKSGFGSNEDGWRMDRLPKTKLVIQLKGFDRPH